MDYSVGSATKLVLACLFVSACASGGGDVSGDSGVSVDMNPPRDLGGDTGSSMDASPGLDAQADAVVVADAGAMDAGSDSTMAVDSGPGPCTPNPCAHDGACATSGTTFTCMCATAYAGATCNSCALGYQDNDGNDTCMPACGSSGVCTGMGCDDSSGSAVCNLCEYSAGARLAWSLTPPLVSNWDRDADIDYDVDNRASLGSFAWTRIGYCLVLDGYFAYAEMDDYTGHNLTRVALPTDWIYKQSVVSLTVRSNKPGVTEVSGWESGHIEMWSNCYSPGLNGIYDYDDTPDTADCHGSFQVHNATSTILAYNGWAFGGGNAEGGLGNGPAGATDWTNLENIGSYSVRRLDAYLVP